MRYWAVGGTNWVSANRCDNTAKCPRLPMLDRAAVHGLAESAPMQDAQLPGQRSGRGRGQKLVGKAVDPARCWWLRLAGSLSYG
jgi:hypothetical protein